MNTLIRLLAQGLLPGLHYTEDDGIGDGGPAPGEGGTDTAVADPPETRTIDGQEVPLSELESAYREREGWQRSNTETAQRLADREREIDARVLEAGNPAPRRRC